jgi:hypothetical protein
MRLLDIDLDLFVNRPAYYQSQDNRLSSEDYRPWPEANVRLFLEKQCGLSTLSPVNGRVINNHHQAFSYWKYLIKHKKLFTPFEVTHVDSHADLGFGDSGYIYLMSDLLSFSINDRTSPKRGSKYRGLGTERIGDGEDWGRCWTL